MGCNFHSYFWRRCRCSIALECLTSIGYSKVRVAFDAAARPDRATQHSPAGSFGGSESTSGLGSGPRSGPGSGPGSGDFRAMADSASFFASASLYPSSSSTVPTAVNPMRAASMSLHHGSSIRARTNGDAAATEDAASSAASVGGEERKVGRGEGVSKGRGYDTVEGNHDYPHSRPHKQQQDQLYDAGEEGSNAARGFQPRDRQTVGGNQGLDLNLGPGQSGGSRASHQQGQQGRLHMHSHHYPSPSPATAQQPYWQLTGGYSSPQTGTAPPPPAAAAVASNVTRTGKSTMAAAATACSPTAAAMQALGFSEAGHPAIIGDVAEPFWVQDITPYPYSNSSSFRSTSGNMHSTSTGAVGAASAATAMPDRTATGAAACWCDPDELFLSPAGAGGALISADDKRVFWEMARALIELPPLSALCEQSCIRSAHDLTAVLRRPEFRVLWLSDAPQYLPKEVASELIRSAYVTPPIVRG